MTQLIPQQKIDEAAKLNSIATDIFISEYEWTKKTLLAEMKNFSTNSFKAGVQFTLKEIEPLICELISWTIAFGGHEVFENNKTSKQLLEEFIEFKNK